MKCSLFYCLAFCLLGGFVSCDKMDSTYKEFLKGGEIRYSARPDSITILPGFNKAKFEMLLVSAPNVIQCKIVWDNGRDSVQVPVTHKANRDTSFASVIIEGLAEGNHVFEIYTYDSSGNPSLKRDTSYEVLGDNFKSTLVNRPVEELTYDGEEATIKWSGSSGENALGQEVKYNTADGAVLLKVAPDEGLTSISGHIINNEVEYRTLYIPGENAIDTFYTEFVTLELPAPIVELDRTKFVAIHLPNDVEDFLATHPLSILWDGNPDQYSWYRSLENTGSGEYMKFTFDLGTVTKLTSYTLWQRGARGGADQELLFANVSPSEWEVWGRLDDPSGTDGSWDGWTRIATNVSYKPSGLPFGQLSPADIAYAAKGEPFEFEAPETIPVRYLRFRIKDTWSPGIPHNSHFFLMEMAFFGIVE